MADESRARAPRVCTRLGQGRRAGCNCRPKKFRRCWVYRRTSRFLRTNKMTYIRHGYNNNYWTGRPRVVFPLVLIGEFSIISPKHTKNTRARVCGNIRIVVGGTRQQVYVSSWPVAFGFHYSFFFFFKIRYSLHQNQNLYPRKIDFSYNERPRNDSLWAPRTRSRGLNFFGIFSFCWNFYRRANPVTTSAAEIATACDINPIRSGSNEFNWIIGFQNVFLETFWYFHIGHTVNEYCSEFVIKNLHNSIYFKILCLIVIFTFTKCWFQTFNGIIAYLFFITH